MNPSSSEEQPKPELVSEGGVTSELTTSHDVTIPSEKINEIANQLASIGDELTVKFDGSAYSRQVALRMAGSTAAQVGFHALLAIIHDG